MGGQHLRPDHWAEGRACSGDDGLLVDIVGSGRSLLNSSRSNRSSRRWWSGADLREKGGAGAKERVGSRKVVLGRRRRILWTRSLVEGRWWSVAMKV